MDRCFIPLAIRLATTANSSPFFILISSIDSYDCEIPSNPNFGVSVLKFFPPDSTTFRYKVLAANTLIVSVICETDDLIYGENLEGTVSCEFEFTINIYGEMEEQLNFQNQVNEYAMRAVGILLLALVGILEVPALITTLGYSYAYAF